MASPSVRTISHAVNRGDAVNRSNAVNRADAARLKRDEKREAMRAEFLEFKNFPDDWDGYDGHAPAQREIDYAISLIPHIPDAGIDGAKTMVDGGGDVGFEWGRELKLEIGFLDGKLSFFGDTPDGEDISGTYIYDGTVPDDLKRLLSAIFPD